MSTEQNLPPLPAIDQVRDHPEHHMKWSHHEMAWIKRYAQDYALQALAQQAQEPVYQVRGAFDRDPVNTWRDTTETAFYFHPANARRILYTAPQPQPAPLAASAEDMAVYDGIARRYFSDTKSAPLAGELTDDLVRETIKAIQDPDTVDAFYNGYYTLTPEEVRRAILALRPQAVPMTPEQMRKAAMDEMDKIPALANHHAWKGWPGTWAFATAAVNGITAPAGGEG